LIAGSVPSARYGQLVYSLSASRRRWLLPRLLWAALRRPLVLGFLALGALPACWLVGPPLAHAWAHQPLAVPFYAALLTIVTVVFGLAAFLSFAFAFLLYRLVRLLQALARYGRERTRVSAPPEQPLPALAAPSAAELALEEAYSDLGLARGADERAVKAAYRRLVRTLHPDVSQAPDAVERFQRVQAAYDLLTS
jgi:hypothetical protein